MARKLLVFLCLTAPGFLSACASHPDSQAAVWCNPHDGMRFVWIPTGDFVAEVPAEPSDPNDPEKIVHERVAFEQGFWLGRTEVTVGQFRRFVRESGHVTDAEKAGNRFTWSSPGFHQRDNHPVVYVSYGDALGYARWAGVDLPTEAEWVYACRAGTATSFYWGNELDDRYAWHRRNTDGMGTRPVARKLPNAWGLYDMVGNAWEYCGVGAASPDAENRVSEPETCFDMRGGSWTRCSPYRTRHGTETGDLLAESVQPRLHRCDPNPKYPPYPWDDDRGFRCIRRVSRLETAGAGSETR